MCLFEVWSFKDIPILSNYWNKCLWWLNNTSYLVTGTLWSSLFTGKGALMEFCCFCSLRRNEPRSSVSGSRFHQNYWKKDLQKLMKMTMTKLHERRSRGGCSPPPQFLPNFCKISLFCLRFWHFYAYSPLTFKLAPALSNSPCRLWIKIQQCLGAPKRRHSLK